MNRTFSYQKGDEKGIFKLWNRVFGDLLEKNDIFKIDRKWWKWRVLKNPNGKPKIFLEKDERGRVVAHHMIEPFKIFLNGKEKKAFLSTLTMADKNYRGFGILNLVNCSLKSANAEGAISYGFPNKNSLLIFEKFGWKIVGDIPILIRALNPFFYLLDGGNPSSLGVVKEIDCFDKRIDNFIRRLKVSRFCIIRDSAYLNWKYGESSLKRYQKIILERDGKVVGCAVFRDSKINGIKTGIILEIFAENPENFDALISFIIERFKKSGMKMISCFMINNGFYYTRLKKKWFFKLPKFLLPKRNVFVIVSDDPEVLNIKNWYLSYGDWDCF